jgi:putative nucleotidyltransferase with HDIG domain
MATRHFLSLPRSHRLYLGAIILAGAASVALSLVDLARGHIPSEWLILALLTLVSGSAPIRLYSIPVALSVSETFVFTSCILFGASAGTLTVALDAAIISFWSFKRGQKLYKVVFNICALPLTIWLGAHALFAVSDFTPLFGSTDTIELRRLLGPLLLCTVTYFLLSSWLITFAIALESQSSAFRIWRDNFAWISLNYFGGASVAALIVSYTNELGTTFLLIIVTLLPVLAILYATYARRVHRVQDANRHLTELNTLYVSTIETLAMAIDAKDQVTHGHIRRVQQYAVGLAGHLGISEPQLIQAIQAAALLHDMGKLAVPEYILNKPGPLTPAEFERMKLHASIGADILSSINFPYPVVPIVRHHHENWDGSGYPDGLKATQIPMGARILSVVDCYDALTSDRPYRPRLPHHEATKILLARRGTMYDPLVVDTFLNVYEQLAVDDVAVASSNDVNVVALTGRQPRALPNAPPPAGLDDISASTEEMLVLYDLARGLLGRLDLTDTADIISKHLRRIVPASTCVIFMYEVERDALVVAHAAGDNAPHFSGLTIPRGQRLTGWVAANKVSILNSDPLLDLGEAARQLRPRLRSCLSTPLLCESKLVGVLSVYSTIADAFTDDHRRLLEVVARQVSQTIHSAAQSRASTMLSREPEQWLAHRERVERFVAGEIDMASSQSCLSIVDIRVAQAQHRDRRTAPQGATELTTEVVATLRRALRGGDVLFKYAESEYVIVLTQTDPSAAVGVANRITELILEANPSISESLSVEIGVASAPNDGQSLADLVRAAERQNRDISEGRSAKQPSIH